MAKNYESESKNSKNSKNYTGTSSKNTFGNEMNRSENVRSDYETDTKNKTKNKTNDKTFQSYSSEETSRY